MKTSLPRAQSCGRKYHVRHNRGPSHYSSRDADRYGRYVNGVQVSADRIRIYEPVEVS